MRAAAAWLCLLACGCGASPAPLGLTESPAEVAFGVPSVSAHRPQPAPLHSTGVLALPPAADTVLVDVAGEAIHKSQVFDRLAESDPALAQALIDLCVLDRVVDAAVQRFGIDVSEAEIAARVHAEEAALRADASLDESDTALDSLVRGRFGTDLASYRASLRREVARVLLRSYVIRYLALREDAAEVRLFVHHDPAVLADVADRVRRGADFASLARRLSEDESAANGGALPAFGRATRHPVAEAAFRLAPGELSAPIPIDGAARSALVWCVAQRQGRAVSFAAARDEIVKALDTRPITPFEQNAFVVRYCRGDEASAPVDSLDSVPRAR